MRTGLVVAMIGAVLFMAGGVALPWQTFELAEVQASALALGAFGMASLAIAAGVLAVAAWGLQTGHRRRAARLVGYGALALLGCVALSAMHATMGFETMALETVTRGSGWALGLFGALVALGGAAMTRLTLPTWDASTPLLRVTVLGPDGVGGQSLLADRILYEAQTVHVRDLLPSTASTRATARELPVIGITTEGDASIVAGGAAKVRVTTAEAGENAVVEVRERASGVSRKVALPIGDRAVVEVGDLSVACAWVAPAGLGRGTETLQRSEVWAFGAASAAGLLILAATPVLAWSEEAKRVTPCMEGHCPGVVAAQKKEESLTTIDPSEPTLDDAPPETSSKAAGGEEGKFGDPTITEPRETLVPRVDGPMVKTVDPRKIGLNQLLTEKLSDTRVVAEVLRGDMAATTNRIAAAMSGSDATLVLGPGNGGVGFKGDGDGGPGDGDGRIRGLGPIDDGGPGPNVRVALGQPPKRRVGTMDMGKHNEVGYCKTSNIQTVVRQKAGAIRACYEKRLQVKDSLAGKLTVRWSIGLEGKVESATAMTDGLGDPETTRCVLDSVRRMRFDAPEGGMCVVQWPFVFNKG
jgi:hypothetical protein